MAARPKPKPDSIIIDGRCVGRLLNRGCMDVEVFDAAELSIGLFERPRRRCHVACRALEPPEASMSPRSSFNFRAKGCARRARWCA